MSDVLERAARSLIQQPPTPPTTTTELRRRLDRRRQRRSFAVLAMGGLLAVGGIVAVQQRDTDGAAEQPPQETTPETPTPTASTPNSLACDDNGCAGFDSLPVVVGASDFYVGPESLGEPSIALSMFSALARCAELAPDGSTCARLEGIAGVAPVSYAVESLTVDTVTRNESSYFIDIGTTFATITPTQYAQQWGPTATVGETSATSVRGHDAIAFMNDYRPAVVWEERPGVLVWVAVPPELADQLATIAEGVRLVDGPASIPSRVVVPGIGAAYDAGNNSGDGLLVGRIGGEQCIGFADIAGCSNDIGLVTWIDATNPEAVTVSGWAPAGVTAVRISATEGDFVVLEPAPFADYDGAFFTTTLEQLEPGDTPTIVEWLDADGGVVARADRVAVGVEAGESIPWPRPWTSPVGQVVATTSVAASQP